MARGAPRVACLKVFYLEQAITHGKLKITAIPAICSKILADWKAVHDYLTKIAPTQENQGVRNRPQNSELAMMKSSRLNSNSSGASSMIVSIFVMPLPFSW